MEVHEDLLLDIETEINQEPVSTGIRFADYIIDLITFYILCVIAGFAIGYFTPAMDTTVIYIICYMIYVSYFTIIEGATNGRSVGKLITRSKAVKENGDPITWNDAFFRSLSRIVPFEPFSALGGKPWHDTWTHTRVIKNSKP